MNKTKFFALCGAVGGRAVFSLALLAYAANTPAEESAMPQDDAHAWPEVETVRTLLRADAAAALADCRVPGICRPGLDSLGQKVSALRPPADIRVVAIFGISSRLKVDLIVNGTLLRYQAGRQEPIAGAVTAGVYRLLAIDGACVRLRGAEQDHTGCMDAGGNHP
ncbi:hypothetical protein RAS12_12435 [Achromobacter seleniivolatilans]|uniref:Uncharacterized protein n=1 Tax=Achromobacter seleniivolatilans TaxID=3047478 RepID=A0ABY9M821_9BURK|nr:hypothetical protein [Achromobacter sp. R39]WMD23146.1 hypothetical protein RAS12_12435 [Achromobacter sp. R39]